MDDVALNHTCLSLQLAEKEFYPSLIGAVLIRQKSKENHSWSAKVVCALQKKKEA